MGTLLAGIMASQMIDSSGERIFIEGMDVSSMVKDGVAIWEHKKDFPTQIVGKIKYVKKILEESDCETEDQLFFWDQVNRVPYLYGIVEFFDDVGHEGAKACVAMIKYDQKPKLEEEKNVVNFSIDGSKLQTDGHLVKKTIGRDIAVTIKACNKTCTSHEIKQIPVSMTPINKLISFFKSEILVDEKELTLSEKFDYFESLCKADDIANHAKTQLHAALGTPDEHGLTQKDVSNFKSQMGMAQDTVKGRPSANLQNEGKNVKNIAPVAPKAPSQPLTPVSTKSNVGANPSAEKGKGIARSTDTLPVVPKVAITPPRAFTKPTEPQLTTKIDTKSPVKIVSGNEFRQKIEDWKQRKQQKNQPVKEINQGGDVVKEPTTTKTAIPVKKAEIAESGAGGPNSAPLMDEYIKRELDSLYSEWDKKDDFKKFLKKHIPALDDHEVHAIAKVFCYKTTKDKEDDLVNL